MEVNKKVSEPDKPCMVSGVFFRAGHTSEVRFAPSTFNFFLTSKACFSFCIVFQVQISMKNSKKTNRSLFFYHE